jgi:outer membrane murein-binding lipoprotein Lpp
MTLEEKVDSMYQFLIKFQEQVNARFQHLEEKVEAVYQLSMETAHFAQSVSDRLTVIEHKVDIMQSDIAELKADVAELKADVAELKAGQKRIEERLLVSEAKYNQHRTQIQSNAELYAQLEKRLERLEDAIFPPVDAWRSKAA